MDAPLPLDRRAAIKLMFAAMASLAIGELPAAHLLPAETSPDGYGNDPDLTKTYIPGELWPLTLDAKQKRLVVALCDTIIPSDETSPAASTVGVPAFIDEWISSPYPGHASDRELLIEGITWLDAESQRRFMHDFAELPDAQKNAICDDICYLPKAQPDYRRGALFFQRFRDLVAGGFYTTQIGMNDIGYRGNLPSASFEGPPIEALKQLGLA